MENNLQSLKVSGDLFSEVIFVTTFFALHKVHVLSKTRLDVLFTFLLRKKYGKSLIVVKVLPRDWILIG